MTPEVKAIKLAQKFEGLVAHPFDGKGNVRLNESVRQRSLICCNEVIAEIEDLQQNCAMEFPMALEYWHKVKTEITSL
jgi:hypothetical protein